MYLNVFLLSVKGLKVQGAACPTLNKTIQYTASSCKKTSAAKLWSLHTPLINTASFTMQQDRRIKNAQTTGQYIQELGSVQLE